jgi:hypothetical protein
MFAEFKISSTPMSTLIAFRRVSTVYMPRQKTIAPRVR